MLGILYVPERNDDNLLNCEVTIGTRVDRDLCFICWLDRGKVLAQETHHIVQFDIKRWLHCWYVQSLELCVCAMVALNCKI